MGLVAWKASCSGLLKKFVIGLFVRFFFLVVYSLYPGSFRIPLTASQEALPEVSPWERENSMHNCTLCTFPNSEGKLSISLLHYLRRSRQVREKKVFFFLLLLLGPYSNRPCTGKRGVSKNIFFLKRGASCEISFFRIGASIEIFFVKS